MPDGAARMAALPAERFTAIVSRSNICLQPSGRARFIGGHSRPLLYASM